MKELVGTGELVRLILRRDRVRLPVWLLALIGITLLSAVAVADAYPTSAQRELYAATIGSSPTAIAMAGPPVALRTLGGILVYETSMTAMLGVALMAIFLVVRHTRADEEEGRTELLRATVVGRDAHAVAALLVVSAASVVVGAGVTFSLVAAGAGGSGALVYGSAVACFGIFFAAVATLTSQLAVHGRGAVGLALAVLGVSFAIRALGDVRESGLSWLSPMAWPQQVLAFDADRWWPLGLTLLATAVLVVAAARLLAGRDLGAGLLPSRPGRPEASPALAGPIALAARLQRGSVLGWVVGAFLMGATFGSMSQELETMVENNPVFAEYFAASGAASLVDSFFATALLIISLAGGAFAVASVLRLRSEEVADRAELMLTTRLTRGRWMLGGLLVSALGASAVVLAGGLGIGLAYALVIGDATQVLRAVAASAVYVPAALLLGGLAALLVGWLPRAVGVAWGVLAFCFVIGWLGGLLRPPQWVTDISPYSHVPQAPAESVAAAPLLTLTALTVASVALAVVGLQRRDIG